MPDDPSVGIGLAALADYLMCALGAEVEVLALRGLGTQHGPEDPKGFG